MPLCVFLKDHSDENMEIWREEGVAVARSVKWPGRTVVWDRMERVEVSKHVSHF